MAIPNLGEPPLESFSYLQIFFFQNKNPPIIKKISHGHCGCEASAKYTRSNWISDRNLLPTTVELSRHVTKPSMAENANKSGGLFYKLSRKNRLLLELFKEVHKTNNPIPTTCASPAKPLPKP